MINYNYKIVNKGTLFPALLIDDWFNEEEEKCIWRELDFYTKKRFLKRAEDRDDTATNKDGEKLSRSFRIYPCEIFNVLYNYDNYCSDILYYMKKIRDESFREILKEALGEALYRFWLNTNSDSTMISYYENSDYYDTHCDVYNFTILIWFYKKPKLYGGGDLILPETNTLIENKHNRIFIFPSYYLHQVTPINFFDKTNELGFGRYTITHFLWHQPKPKISNKK